MTCHRVRFDANAVPPPPAAPELHPHIALPLHAAYLAALRAFANARLALYSRTALHPLTRVFKVAC